MSNYEEAARSLTALASGFEGNLTVFAKDLSTGLVLEHRADEVTATASCIKLFVLLALMRRVDAGEIDLDQSIEMSASDQVGGSGILRTLSPGLVLPLRDVASLMITLSDNTATNMIVDLLGLDGVNADFAALGFTSTRLVNRIDFQAIGDDLTRLAISTAHEFGLALEGIARATVLSPAACAFVREVLGRQQYLDLIPRYLPFNPYAEDLGGIATLRVANKTGFFPGFRGDVGLLTLQERTIVAAVLASGGSDRSFLPENSVARLVGKVGEIVWNCFSALQ